MSLRLARTRRELALEVWSSFNGSPYEWGGDDNILGPDCSGLMLEGLYAAGIVPPNEDTTAHGLARRFRALEVAQGDVIPGCLLFWDWGGDGKIDHVEGVVCVVDRQPFTIGASGGGSRHRTPLADIARAIRGEISAADLVARSRLRAARDNAVVKVRPARPNWVAAVDPFREG